MIKIHKKHYLPNGPNVPLEDILSNKGRLQQLSMEYHQSKTYSGPTYSLKNPQTFKWIEIIWSRFSDHKMYKLEITNKATEDMDI